MTYNVTLQRQYPDGDLVVEVGIGGYNYANPGQLGGCEEFLDPRAAASYAIQLAQVEEIARKEIVEVAHGYTMGMTMPFSPCTPEELTEWAEEQYELRPKCDWCGEVLPDNFVRGLEQLEDEQFCDSFCAEYRYNSLCRQCPSCEEWCFDDWTIEDHGVCYDCNRQMLNGERCRLCYEAGHGSSRCPYDQNRETDWIVRAFKADVVVATWEIFDRTEREAEAEALADVEKISDYQVDDWTMEEMESCNSDLEDECPEDGE